MSAVLYDRALLTKIKSWTEGTNVHVYGPDETRRMFEVLADENNDSPIKLPIICLRRSPGGYELLSQTKRPTSYDGVRDNTDTVAFQLNHIPISLSYQIDVYAKYMHEADAYMREIIFNLINAPTVDVVVPYMDTNITQRSAISIGSNVDDLSSIPERLITGQFTRLSISFTIPDAHIFDVRAKGYVQFTHLIGGDLLIETNQDDIVVEDLDFGDTEIIS